MKTEEMSEDFSLKMKEGTVLGVPWAHYGFCVVSHESNRTL